MDLKDIFRLTLQAQATVAHLNTCMPDPRCETPFTKALDAVPDDGGTEFMKEFRENQKLYRVFNEIISEMENGNLGYDDGLDKAAKEKAAPELTRLIGMSDRIVQDFLEAAEASKDYGVIDIALSVSAPEQSLRDQLCAEYEALGMKNLAKLHAIRVS